jgi:hypothetical protein
MPNRLAFDKRIYLKAARQIFSQAQFADLLSNNEMTLDADNNKIVSSSWSDDFVENLISSWWVHIADDFAMDIVAAKSLNMRTIWVNELVHGKIQKIEHSSVAKSSRTVQDLVKEVSQSTVVEMQMGAEDYLAQSLEAEFVDAVVHQFADLRDVIYGWNEKPALSPEKTKNNDLETNAADFEFVTIENPETKPSSPVPVKNDAKNSSFARFVGQS